VSEGGSTTLAAAASDPDGDVLKRLAGWLRA
jgi:hypothetical protein